MTNQNPLISPPLPQAPLIKIEKLSHSFGKGLSKVRVLHDIDLSIDKGKIILIKGPSGSGKTTLLTLISCLRSVESGSVQLSGLELFGASEDQMVAIRRRLGFIFQLHNLHSSLTAMQNVLMGLEVHKNAKQSLNLDLKSLSAKGISNRNEQACAHLLGILGLQDRMHYYPDSLSGGQNQRVAIARALIGNPELIIADEPTAALDIASGMKIMGLLRQLAAERGTTTLMVSHDSRLFEYADHIITLEDGRLIL